MTDSGVRLWHTKSARFMQELCSFETRPKNALSSTRINLQTKILRPEERKLCRRETCSIGKFFFSFISFTDSFREDSAVLEEREMALLVKLNWRTMGSGIYLSQCWFRKRINHMGRSDVH